MNYNIEEFIDVERYSLLINNFLRLEELYSDCKKYKNDYSKAFISNTDYKNFPVAYVKSCIDLALITVAHNISHIYENLDSRYKIDLEKFPGLKVLDKLHFKKDCDIKEKIKQIRNCFAHGDYKLYIEYKENSLNATIKLKNKFVEGIISYEEVNDLFFHAFKEIGRNTVYSKKNYFLVFLTPIFKITNYKTLNDFANKIKCFKITGKNIPFQLHGDNIDETVKDIDKKYGFEMFRKNMLKMKENKNFNNFKIEEEKITEEHKKLFKLFIKKVGFKTFSSIYRLKVSDRNQIINDIMAEIFNPYLDIQSQILSPISIFLLKRYKKFDYNTTVIFLHGLFISPISYVNVVLLHAFFSLNYLRELNMLFEQKLFDYKNFDLKGIKYSSTDSKEKIVKESSDKEKYEKNIVELRLREKKLQQELDGLIISKNKLEDVKNKNPRKEEFLEIKKVQIIKKNQEILEIQKQLLQELNMLNSANANIQNDCRNLFRYIRNAISHGTYEIDYLKFLKSENIDDIVIHFSNYDVEKESTFSLDTDLFHLKKLIKQVDSRVFISLQGIANSIKNNEETKENNEKK